MDLHGELSLNFWGLQAEETFREDSEAVQRKSGKISAIPFPSMPLQLPTLEGAEDAMLVRVVPRAQTRQTTISTSTTEEFMLVKTTLLVRGNRPKKQ